VNATLRRGDDVETITAERAAELLAEKRAKGPTPKKRPAKRTQAAAANAAAPKPAAKRVAAKKVRAEAG
jgi:DNA topoisomerase-1